MEALLVHHSPWSDSIISDYKFVILILNACLVKLSFSCSESLIECSCCQDKSISGFISYALCAADEALKVQIGCLQKMRRKKKWYHFLIFFCGNTFFFYICIYELLGSDWSCIRESLLVEGLEASQTF